MRQAKEGAPITMALRTRLYFGFGGWEIMRDNEVFYVGPPDRKSRQYPTLVTFEKQAKLDPDHDWRAVYFGPMRDATYQRQGDGKWVLIKSGNGFA